MSKNSKGILASQIFLIVVVLVVSTMLLVIFHIESTKNLQKKSEPKFDFDSPNLNYPTVGEDDSLWIEMEVRNEGSKQGTEEIKLKVDGEVLSRKKVSLNPHESKKISFNLKNQNIGKHKLSLNGETQPFKVSKNSNLPQADISISPSEETGDIKLTHGGGMSIKGAIDKNGNLGNIGLEKNGQLLSGTASISGDGDTDLEPGETLKFGNTNLAIGDHIKAINTSIGTTLSETEVPWETSAVDINREELPEDTPKLDEKLNRYVKTDPTNKLEEDSNKAIVNFNVPKSWISKNDIDEEKVSLMGLDKSTNEWKPLNASKVSEDENSVRYRATSYGAEYFAVAGEKKDASSSIGASYFPLIMVIIAIAIIIVEVSLLWRTISTETGPTEKEKRISEYEKLIIRFVRDGRNRAAIRTNRPTDEVLDSAKVAISNLDQKSTIEARVVDEKVHLVRKSEGL